MKRGDIVTVTLRISSRLFRRLGSSLRSWDTFSTDTWLVEDRSHPKFIR